MTILTAVKKNGQIAIASDTLSTSNKGALKTLAEYKTEPSKLISFGDCVLGVAGSFAVKQVFIDLLEREPPEQLQTRNEIYRWLLSIQKSLKNDYFIKSDNGNDKGQPLESQWLQGLMINTEGVFFISPYREVTQYTKFWAIGSGSRFALGALEVLYAQDLSATDIAAQAAAVATKFSPSCAEPIVVETLQS